MIHTIILWCIVYERGACVFNENYLEIYVFNICMHVPIYSDMYNKYMYFVTV